MPTKNDLPTIVLVTNKIFHYRIPIYNYFAARFEACGYRFVVITNAIDRDNPYDLHFECHIHPFSLPEYTALIKIHRPVAVIHFLHLSDWISWPLVIWYQLKGIRTVYWGHGINLLDKDNRLKNYCYAFFHAVSSAIILYSENEKKHVRESYRHKIFIAGNTLCFDTIPAIAQSKSELKRENNYADQKLVLFVSRIKPNKRLDDLIHASRYLDAHIRILIVGPGLSPEQAALIANLPNITYLGPIYHELSVNRIFKMSDIFCIPGANGLSLNQAFFWGLPAVTEDLQHGPEIAYLKNGRNGFIVPVGAVDQLAGKINYLCSSDEILERFSAAARSDILLNASIDRMFKGFRDAVEFVQSKTLPDVELSLRRGDDA